MEIGLFILTMFVFYMIVRFIGKRRDKIHSEHREKFRRGEADVHWSDGSVGKRPKGHDD